MLGVWGRTALGTGELVLVGRKLGDILGVEIWLNIADVEGAGRICG